MARKDRDNIFGGNGGMDENDPRRYLMGGAGGIPMIVVGDRGDRYPQPQQPLQRHSEEPPVRAQMAMEYLKLCVQMEAKRPVIYPVASTGESQAADVKILDGHDLTGDEVAARSAAGECLMQYFSGKLKMNAWEEADMKLTPTAAMNCFCLDPTNPQSRPASNCPICGGRGQMHVVLDPANIQQMALQASGKDVVRTPHPELIDKPPTPRKRGSDQP